ncbi:hypothetical protein [Streptomyces olivochromogenes]|uniref:Uncharacterized protein n=1 Tax=Streptomyces olivochromogenes TaxID=1963 RepID=A0A250V9S5_STROL|nr:hypothetical protein [Streptomyces olivochromogenes]KUN47899.1 hypothetical protein AQJ27_07535 [Streptomyces olivochromogenes]GAX50766.1 hypothetical protein SO3561_02265 [Streptomyces olivochromogenes]
MAEHDAERGEPDEKGVPVGEPLGDEQGVPFDEDAAWQAIVAGYGEEPPDPPGAKPFKSIEDLALLDPVTNDAPGGKEASERPEKGKKNETGGTVGTSEKDGAGDEAGESPAAAKPLGGSVSFAPGVGGPRDYQAPEPSEDDFDGDDEGHFVPPEPPPLPTADTTAKFAWLAVVGGPIVLLLTILLGWDMTWWLATVGIGGFLGGFATLVARMKPDDEDEDDPGRGAVV